MIKDKYCMHCSNSFVNGIDPDYDGSASTIGKSDKHLNMFVSSAGLNKPAPVLIEYCPFCGRLIKGNIPYLEKEELIDNNKTLLLKG